jgi:phage terminase large subunit-like protein
MSSPTKELEKLILSGKIAHGGNPVLAWMASNVVVSQDAAGNIKPDKGKSIERIDGIVSLIMGVSRAVAHETEESVYNERGLMLV